MSSTPAGWASALRRARKDSGVGDYAARLGPHRRKEAQNGRDELNQAM